MKDDWKFPPVKLVNCDELDGVAVGALENRPARSFAGLDDEPVAVVESVGSSKSISDVSCVRDDLWFVCYEFLVIRAKHKTHTPQVRTERGSPPQHNHHV